jgi:hypothetical protein
VSGTEKKYRKFHNLDSREIEGDFFVVDNLAGSIHSLGQSGSAVWRLLDEPLSKKDCMTVFDKAFPQEGEEKIKALVNEIFSSLEEKGLIY